MKRIIEGGAVGGTVWVRAVVEGWRQDGDEERERERERERDSGRERERERERGGE